MNRPHGTHPVYWRTMHATPPAEWARVAVEDMAEAVKGKLPKALSDIPTPNSVPYLLIDGLENGGASLYTESDGLPMVSE